MTSEIATRASPETLDIWLYLEYQCVYVSMFINYLAVCVGMFMTEYFGHVTETLDIWLYLEYLRVYVSMFIN